MNNIFLNNVQHMQTDGVNRDLTTCIGYDVVYSNDSNNYNWRRFEIVSTISIRDSVLTVFTDSKFK